jgi:hypothetical protein
MMANRKADREHMQQMMARKEATHDKLDTDRAQMDAEMKTIKATTKAFQARTKAIPDNLDSH